MARNFNVKWAYVKKIERRFYLFYYMKNENINKKALLESCFIKCFEFKEELTKNVQINTH